MKFNLFYNIFSNLLDAWKFLFLITCFFLFFSGELCRPLNCKKKDLCLLKDTFTAVCVSKKELEKSG